MPLNVGPAPLFLSSPRPLAGSRPPVPDAGAGSGPTTQRPPGTSHPIGRLNLNLVLDRLDFQMDHFVDRRSKSLWMDVAVAPSATPLQGDKECDVVIVGAGIAGISTAYELAIEGSHVIVLDRGKIAGGITARTSAHLAPLCDDLTSAMISLRGEEISRRFYQSQAAAVDRIEEIQKRESIDCDFRRLDGYLFQALNTDSKIIEDELDAVRKVGAPVHRLVGVPLAHCERQHVLRYPRQGTFHPLKYLKGLVAAVEAKGGSFHGDTVVERFEERDDGKVVVTAGGGTITARAAVVATNAPIVDRFALHTKMAPYRTYAMAFSIPKGAIPDALYWDTLDPYHYVRLQPGDGRTDFLIVGGGDHKSGEADDAEVRFQALEAWTRNLIPAAQDVTHRWSGQVLDTIDYAGFIGRNPGSNNIYVHTGDSGQGMTHGVVGAMINSALILGREAKWAEVYEPSRKTPAAIGNFLRENVTAVKNFAEYLAPGELADVSDLKAGHGAIIRQGMSKIAAYRDPSGKLYAALCRLYAYGLPPALEFLRDVLGLPLSRISLCNRWNAAQCSRHRPSRRGEHQDALRGIRRRRSRRRTADFTPFGNLNRLNQITARTPPATFDAPVLSWRTAMLHYPRPPFPSQHQPMPGKTAAMNPAPDHGETSYKGSGRLNGKKAVITGGDSGIGRAVAIAYAREGADVLISYLDEHDDARETERLVKEAGRKAVLLPGDIQDPGQCRAVIAKAVSELGGIDILVNNAAHQASFKSIDEISDEEWELTFKVNIHAMFYLTKAAVAPHEAG